ncbi:hypothetical protein [Fimbriiglobus ruber]|uniref:Uncharacterized protein n=1 Tax=Fimbriiglobus ruber TaxID=1908690 RepID=A0A225D051_9BACT|nr:hypothetical protein [Fimbriiglobus ruber]OWK34313.1 hypothetical protein FRUB_10284 [Fimbriiglobus ruber]
MADEFIALDYCGWNQTYGRFTHIPSGDTLLCLPGMGQREWDEAQWLFLQQYPGLNVHMCPGAYTTDAKLLGSADEICERLVKRLPAPM